MTNQIIFEVWGDLACFTRPETKVERLTYPVPTPSAMRGLLSAIYSKPNEFYWQINRIEVLNPIKYMTFKRNEVKERININFKPIDIAEARTQRHTVFLKDVRYRVYATIVKREGYEGKTTFLYDQATRRLKTGKCFYQPYLGCKECIAYYELYDPTEHTQEPISMDLDLGYMLYDVFDLHDYELHDTVKFRNSTFLTRMEQGVVTIPDFDDKAVLKSEVLDNA